MCKQKNTNLESMKPVYLLFLLLVTFGHMTCFAQYGQYDIRFKINDFSCSQDKLFIDIEVRAELPATTFFISDQNYRFSFNPLAIDNPYIVQELTLSGMVSTASPPSVSLYSPHTLVGSIDSIVSYNVEMQAGDGYPLDDVDYVKVGRIGFDLIDPNACLDLYMHTKAQQDFPNTLVSEVYNGSSYGTKEGSYGHYLHCMLSPCMNNPPNAADDYFTTIRDSAMTYGIALNDTDNFGNLDYGSLRLISIPTTSEGWVSVDTTTGQLTFTPDQGFVGSVTPFQYEICDEGTSVPSTIGYHNPSDQSLPIPNDTIFQLSGPLCDTATVYISVEPPIEDPDLAPVVTVIPANIQGLSTVGVAISISELAGFPTNGTVIVRIPKDPRLVFAWDPTLTFVAFNSVDNADWTYSATSVFHQFLYINPLPAFDYTAFGFVATYDPQNTDGQTTLTATIVPFTGGDTKPNNNADSEIIIYFD